MLVGPVLGDPIPEDALSGSGSRALVVKRKPLESGVLCGRTPKWPPVRVVYSPWTIECRFGRMR